MKRIRFVALIVGLVLLAHGGVTLSHTLSTKQPTTFTCEEFMRRPPDTKWLRVTGCDIDYSGVAYRESRGHLDELFFPVRLRSQTAPTPILLIVATKDSQALAAAGQTIGSGKQPDQEAYDVTMLRVITMLRAAKEVDGYRRSGFFEVRQTRRALAGLAAPLAPNFVALDLHATPSAAGPAVEAAAGLGLLIVGFITHRRLSRSATIDDLDTYGAEEMLTPPSPPMLLRLPHLMLLNLEPHAGLDDIERAPSMGTREDVKALLTAVLPSLTTTADDRAVVGGPGWNLTFDLGDDDVVWTITVAARGTNGSISALEDVVRRTGWRVFAPRRGIFVEGSGLEALANEPLT